MSDQPSSSRGPIPMVPSAEDCYLRLGNEGFEKDSDLLLYFGLGVRSHDMKAMFGDVEIICFTPSPHYAKSTAYFMAKAFGCDEKFHALMLQDLSPISQTYALYKVGPVLTISHGIGMSSVSIVLHEISKLLHQAEVEKVIFLRLGTSVGIGLKLGTAVISDSIVGTDGEEIYKVNSLGTHWQFPAVVDASLKIDLQHMLEPDDKFDIISGRTMTCNDFYVEQLNSDGALCTKSEDQKFICCEGLRLPLDVIAMDMESLAIAAFAEKSGGTFGSIGVALEDAFKNKDADECAGDWKSWMDHPKIIACRFAQFFLMKSGKTANTSGFPPCERCVNILDQNKALKCGNANMDEFSTYSRCAKTVDQKNVLHPDCLHNSGIEPIVAGISLDSDESYSCPHVIKSTVVLADVEKKCIMYNN